ncbi:MAG: 4Fe-4S dicluster domain-containing protein [Phycisphaerae bacterium]|nr:4Fe-4S dicluster domain-containing protein [Phycisphaerae bacterium]
MPDRPIDDLPPHDRRRFFAAGFGRVIRPLAEYLEKRLPFPLPQGRDVLRPPGALPEREFLDTCYRSGACADVCPAKCIRLVQGDDEETRGTPLIDPDLAACVVCEELACMRACPSGALSLVGKHAIRMGLAIVREQTCVRSRGDDCRICVERCPLGGDAIRIGDDGRVDVIDPAKHHGIGCVGCGVCQFYCPTTPKAIYVRLYP